MIELVKNIIDNPLISSIISIFFFSVIYFINYWDITEFEKKVMTNFQKFKIYVSFITLISIIMTFVIWFLDYKNNKDIITFITLFVLTFILIIIVHFLTWLVNVFFAPRYEYTISFNNDEDEWSIVKAVVSKGVLLKNSRDEYMIIKDYNNCIIKKVPIERFKWISTFYKPNKWFYITESMLMIFIVVTFFLIKINEVNVNNWLLIFFLIFIIFFTIFLAIFFNFIVLKIKSKLEEKND